MLNALTGGPSGDHLLRLRQTAMIEAVSCGQPTFCNFPPLLNLACRPKARHHHDGLRPIQSFDLKRPTGPDRQPTATSPDFTDRDWEWVSVP
jgi:hypothetical protein